MAKRRRDVAVPEDNGEYVVKIENFGPIELAEYKFIPGRITVAYGSNGAGKSESQIATDALMGMKSAKDKLSLREGAEHGRVSGFGRELKFTARRCEQTGKINVLVVEEGFSLARFVRPGFKDPEANDRQRLKDLASVLSIKLDPKAVHKLVGGLDEERAELDSEAEGGCLSPEELQRLFSEIERRESAIYNDLVSEKTSNAEGKDPAEYVAYLKADCDHGALENEKLVIALTGEADGLADTLPEIAEGTESDAQILSERLADAVQAKRDLTRRDESAVDAERLAVEAERIMKAGQGQTVEAAEAALKVVTAEVEESEKLIAEMEAALGRAKSHLQTLTTRLSDATTAKQQAEDRQTEITGARLALAAKFVRPTDQEWADAEAAIKTAEDAVSLGSKIRESVITRGKILAKRQEAIEVGKEAEGLRAAAKGAVGLLVNPINELQCGIEIDESMRLIFTEHPIRGRCPVEDLSPGESWSLVIRLLVKVVGGEQIEAFVTIPQEALEGLDPINLKMLIEAVAKTRLMVFVAKATATEMPGGELIRDSVFSKLVETWKDLR